MIVVIRERVQQINNEFYITSIEFLNFIYQMPYWFLISKEKVLICLILLIIFN